MKILKKYYAALTSNTATAYTANDLNQYAVTSNPTEAFSHDFDGNMTLDRQFVYTWDAENRLMEVQTRIDWGQYSDAYETGDKHVYFAYDYMGRRVRKRVETYNGSSWPETSDELFVYDGWNVAMVLNANASNAITRKFTWGLDLSGTLHGAGGIGGLLAVDETQGAYQGAYWFFYDGNGNVGQLVKTIKDGQGNITGVESTLAARYEYDPYGNPIPIPQPPGPGPYADLNPIRFSTKWFDTETGLYYYGYRYYSPRPGRWISRDPMEEKGGLNLHQSLRNDPVNQIDAEGSNPVAGSVAAMRWFIVTWEILNDGIDLFGIAQLVADVDDRTRHWQKPIGEVLRIRSPDLIVAGYGLITDASGQPPDQIEYQFCAYIIEKNWISDAEVEIECEDAYWYKGQPGPPTQVTFAVEVPMTCEGDGVIQCGDGAPYYDGFDGGNCNKTEWAVKMELDVFMEWGVKGRHFEWGRHFEPWTVNQRLFDIECE